MGKKNQVSESETALQLLKSEPNEAQKLQQEIEKRTKELEQCLKKLDEKKRLSENRSVFIEVMDKLERAESELIEDSSFDSGDYKLKFLSSVSSYRDEDVFAIGNRELILEFIRFIRIKVVDKIRDIEQKLIA